MAEEARVEKKSVSRSKQPHKREFGKPKCKPQEAVGLTSFEAPGNNATQTNYSKRSNYSSSNYSSTNSYSAPAAAAATVSNKLQKCNRSFSDRRMQPRTELNWKDDDYARWDYSRGASTRFSGGSGKAHSRGGAFRGSRMQHGDYQHTAANHYNKEQYVQAMCQFVVLEGGAYGSHVVDPDLLVDWDHIEELRLLDEEIPSCPICLYPPVAAKMTRCGHVFCWTCVLHYLALSDHAWRKCPICYEAVYENQLKSVVAATGQNFAIGEEISMCLMKRCKDSTIALPITVWSGVRGYNFVKISEKASEWSKLILANIDDISETILTREATELEVLMALEGDQPEAVFIHRAFALLEVRRQQLCTKAQLKALEAPQLTSVSSVPKKIASNLSSPAKPNDDVMHSLTAAMCSSSTPRSRTKDYDSRLDDTEGAFYFYQAANRQLIFLHPISARMLMAEYGHLKFAPHEIKGRIVQLDRHVMNAEFRKRYRYLSHLPVTAGFLLAEVEFDRSILSPETVGSFADELERRQQERNRQAARDRRMQVAAHRYEQHLLLQQRGYAGTGPSALDNRLGADEVMTIRVVHSAQNEVTSAQRPSISDNSSIVESLDNLDLTENAHFPGLDRQTRAVPIPVNQPAAPSVHSMSPVEPEGAMSFAQKLRSAPKFSSPSSEPDLMSSNRHNKMTTDGSFNNVSGWVSLSARNNGAGTPENVDTSEDRPAPNYSDAFGVAFEAAFDNLKTNWEQKADDNDKKGKKGKKNQKKQRGKVIFST